MCGIAGIYARPESRAPQNLLLAMAGELRHRGPDGTGLYLDGRYGMANTRLAIVDLAGGDQPIATEDGRYWAMQNGEVYNHVELRAELAALGRRFATTCDTEVIAHAYAEWGPACLDRLNGDFALAVWDRREQELFLARDRFGVRPLFVA
ncbi:MAG: asparagine synthase (glutamine-hydrolyzing), partial [Gaiellaceae bacterium]